MRHVRLIISIWVIHQDLLLRRLLIDAIELCVRQYF